MKKTVRDSLIIGGAALMMFVSTSPLQAAGRPKGPPPGGGTNQVINLTTAQQQALKDAHAAIVTQSEALFTQMEAARKALQTAVLADTVNEDAIRAAAKTIGDIEGSLAVIRAKELAKVKPLFTADQWTQLKASGLFDHELFGPHGGDRHPPTAN